MAIERYEINITGIVQGVGFRPFVYKLATSLSLNGWVNNMGAGVVIDVEGEPHVLRNFIDRLRSEAPPLSQIKDLSYVRKPNAHYSGFVIKESGKRESGNVFISPDVSICPDCQHELFDVNDRRYLYPFINCTNCGPRFTIVTGIPYDRINTTMHKFKMCKKCADEYTNPLDRRYHAQPVSCYECGPQLFLLDHSGCKIDTDDIVGHTRKLLSEGSIVAIKGLGGYHLACDAHNSDAVEKLRKRKLRDDKPFALMVKDYDTALGYCEITAAERKLLESPKKPIVLLRKRKEYDLPEDIAPQNPYLGLMLPYTPIHLLLFRNEIDTLVMTSGNRSSEPIYYRDDEALENLKDIADYFLANDRDIHIRTDDSVTRVFGNKEYPIRRSRGYVPSPITVDALDKLESEYGQPVPSILACGGELKSTFCLSRGNEFYMSHHIGDLENAETLASFEEGIRHFQNIFSLQPDIIAYDMHPDYLSTGYALARESNMKLSVQHHHAHIASCMADNGLSGKVIGVAFDGTGFGEDGNIWGGEFFAGGYTGFERTAHMEYIKMPGGEAAVREPWRMAVSYLDKAGLLDEDSFNSESGLTVKGMKLLGDVKTSEIRVIMQMLARGVNSPYTSSMGRFFDAISALIGVRSRINYEGQAAIELEYAAGSHCTGIYDYTINKSGRVPAINPDDIIKGIVKDLANGLGNAEISAKFHQTIANAVLEVCSGIRQTRRLNRVALSGGVFQNMTLLSSCVTKLEAAGFEVFIHGRVPSNDGGIALGQAVMAAVQYMKNGI